jgi:hypothetical protein
MGAYKEECFHGAITNHLEEKQKSSLANPIIRCSRGQRRIKKLESSIKYGFESAVNKTDHLTTLCRLGFQCYHLNNQYGDVVGLFWRTLVKASVFSDL